MKLSNLEMSEKSIDVQENDKDVQENGMLLAEVRRQINPLSFCACTHFVHRTSAEERGAILIGTSAHSLGKFVQTKGAEGSSENVGSARAIIYAGHFIRAGFFFLVHVPILPVLGLPFQ